MGGSDTTDGSMLGRTIEGKYEIVRLIGEGGMGSVYEARHTMLGRKVAVKVLLPEVASDPGIVQRFHNEARIAASLGHENVIEVTDMGVLPGGAPFLVMEYLQGQSLARRLEDAGRLGVAEAIGLMLPVLDALAVVHETGVVHRDLKPDNVFLAERSGAGGAHTVVKLLDFGISKLRTPGPDGTLHLTRTGTVLGTPYYMAPEQAAGAKDIDHRADLYAVGVMLYELLTGERPFQGDTYNALLAAILTKDPRPPRQLCADIPAKLEAVILRALARDPGHRFASAAEFLGALAPFAPAGKASGVAARSTAGLPTKSAVGTPGARAVDPAPTAAGSGAGRRWIVVVVLLLAAAATAVVLLLNRGPDEATTRRTAVVRTEPAPPPVSTVDAGGTAALPPPPPPPVSTVDAGGTAALPPPPPEPDATLVALAPDAPPAEPPAPVDTGPAGAEPRDAGRRVADGRRVPPSAPEAGIGVPPPPPPPPPPTQPEQPSRAAILPQLDAIRSAVYQCYGYQAGRVSCDIDFEGAGGTVSAANVTGVPSRPGLAPCVRDALRGVRVPPFTAPSFHFRHTYTFEGMTPPAADAGGATVVRPNLEGTVDEL